ncbi:MAG: hypothetical protein N838_07215 [Thiohalocapsa sp. PB-PSB1]|jgi:hypothetical protein|nr:MAG: hypothetical protein N838_33110 [Thiohalocapsa sp. PB-PSB1]QQO53181.1 MAG: hypothetical protein N838_07215 [Thiohalocapsa sp. PB-PSB1]
MSVIIDQFEVIVDSQNPQDETQPSAALPAQPPQPALQPYAIEGVFEQMQERADRVRAH